MKINRQNPTDIPPEDIGENYEAPFSEPQKAQGNKKDDASLLAGIIAFLFTVPTFFGYIWDGHGIILSIVSAAVAFFIIWLIFCAITGFVIGIVQKAVGHEVRVNLKGILSKESHLLSWIFVVLCIILRFAYSGYPAPVILFTLVGLAALPINPIRNLWEKLLNGRSGWVRPAILAVIFLVAVGVTPSAKEIDAAAAPPPDTADRATVLAGVSSEDIPAGSPMPAASPDPTPEPTEVPTPASTPEPTPEPTPAPTSAPTPEPQPIRGLAPGTTVYVSDRSNTIHSVSDCSGMRNYREMTIYDADQRGYQYCPNCW